MNIFRKYLFRLSFLCVVSFSMPFFVSAQIIITEIMYDAPGADTGHEWIELYNAGADAIDLKNWKFFEADTNHGLVSVVGGTSIPAPGYAIIADNGTQFLSDFPAFSGVLFDSSFSLKGDTGEAIAIRNEALENVDALTYNPTLGAAGDGKTLQKNGNTWSVALPTPGAGYNAATTQGTSTTTTTTTGVANSSSTTSQGSSGSFPVEPQIFAKASGSNSLLAGADALFSARAYGLKKEPIETARFVWNFGDGGTKEGKNVLYGYHYPGNYIIVLDISSGQFSATDVLRVSVRAPDIAIAAVSLGIQAFIEITNRSAEELDLSFWHIRTNGKHFTLPKNTRIIAKQSVKFSSTITGLSPRADGSVALLYPNGEVAFVGGGAAIETERMHGGTVSETPAKKKSPLVQKEEAMRANVITETSALENAFLNQAAVAESILAVDSQTKGDLLKWLLALFGVIILAVSGVILLRFIEAGKNGNTSVPEILSADDFDIIEIKEK